MNKKIKNKIVTMLLRLSSVNGLTGKPLTVKDFSGYNQPFHPSVLYFEDGLFGHRYWMAQTPFPVAALPYRDRWECPCIYWSDDGENWETCEEINPLDNLNTEEILNEDYFSDPHLVYRNDIKLLECWYRITHINKNANGKQSQYPTFIVRKTTKDGFHWTSRELLIDLQSNNSIDNMVRSQSVIWDNDRNVYRMWYVDTPPGLSNRKIIYAESRDGITWSKKTVTSMDRYIDPWHIDVNYFEEKYHLINYTLSGNKGINYYESNDGISFEYIKELLRPSAFLIGRFYWKQLYRSCSLKANDGIRVYFSASDGLKTYLGLMKGDNFNNLKVVNYK